MKSDAVMSNRDSIQDSIIVLLLLFFISLSNVIAIAPHQLISRYHFVADVLDAVTITNISQQTFQNSPGTFSRLDGILSFPLRFLPDGGCWALRVTLSSSSMIRYGKEDKLFTYFGIVDTGSPFVTNPSQAEPILQSSRYDQTNEQYGEVIGGME